MSVPPPHPGGRAFSSGGRCRCTTAPETVLPTQAQTVSRCRCTTAPETVLPTQAQTVRRSCAASAGTECRRLPHVREGGLAHREAVVVARSRPKLCCLRRHRPLVQGCTHPHLDVHPCGHPQDGDCFEKTTLFSVLTATPPNGGEGCFRSPDRGRPRVTRGARNVYNTRGILSRSEQKEKNDQALPRTGTP